MYSILFCSIVLYRNQFHDIVGLRQGMGEKAVIIKIYVALYLFIIAQFVCNVSPFSLYMAEKSLQRRSIGRTSISPLISARRKVRASINAPIFEIPDRKKRIVVVGGGAAGFFAAVQCATTLNRSGSHEVVLLESGKQVLTKVAISGGGRCNVMHDPSKGVMKIATVRHP